MIRRLSLAALVGLPTEAHAQLDQTNLRYDEDWASARDSPEQEQDWWRALKDRPVGGGGALRVTLGAEARARYEGFANNLLSQAQAPDDGYLWLRALPFADVQADRVRVFAQGIAGYAAGVATGAGPVDETGLDLLQGFADLRLPVGRGSTITVRAGRELIALGSERLVGVRYGPNIPRAFQGVRIMLERDRALLQAFRLHPISVGPKDFDDRSDSARRLDGIYATLPAAQGFKVDLYWLGYRNAAATFGATQARERRDTFGIRLFGTRGDLSFNWELMLQRGRLGTADIRAWSLASETSYVLTRVPLSPRVRLRANFASGDRHPGDNHAGAFNALFPKGKYFGELSLIGPRNIVNLNPGISINLRDDVVAEFSAATYWRASRGDGVYDVSGLLVQPAAGSNARHIGEQLELLLSWQVSPVLSFSASASTFVPGKFLLEHRIEHPVRMMATEVMFRF